MYKLTVECERAIGHGSINEPVCIHTIIHKIESKKYGCQTKITQKWNEKYGWLSGKETPTKAAKTKSSLLLSFPNVKQK